MMKRITPEMAMEAYKAISGKKTAKAAVKASATEVYVTSDYNSCCGLAAIYIKDSGGKLGEPRLGLEDKLDEYTFVDIETYGGGEIEDYIFQHLFKTYDLDRNYCVGFVKGFDDDHTTTVKDEERTGYEDGLLVASVLSKHGAW